MYIYIMAKGNCFPSSSVLENLFYPLLKLHKLLHNQKWIKEHFEFYERAIYDDSE